MMMIRVLGGRSVGKGVRYVIQEISVPQLGVEVRICDLVSPSTGLIRSQPGQRAEGGTKSGTKLRIPLCVYVRRPTSNSLIRFHWDEGPVRLHK